LNTKLWLEHLDGQLKLLGLKKVKAPVDILEKLNSISATVQNPVSRAFQTAITVSDINGDELTIFWPDQQHVEAAMSEHFALVQMYLEARKADVSGADFLAAYALDVVYKESKPVGFVGVAGITLSADILQAMVANTLTSWNSSHGDIEYTKKTKRRKTRKEPYSYETDITALRARVAKLEKAKKAS
jgi:hypothetical protein